MNNAVTQCLVLIIVLSIAIAVAIVQQGNRVGFVGHVAKYVFLIIALFIGAALVIMPTLVRFHHSR